MKEELISFDTAKLAKEKGFDLPIQRDNYRTELAFYDDKMLFHSHGSCEEFPIAPTQSLLQKWLWEKHKHFVSVEPYLPLFEVFLSIIHSDTNHRERMRLFDKMVDPYIALEKGLQKALKLIKV